MRNVLCRHCFRLFRYDEIGVICRSNRCARIPDDRGKDRPRYMRPKDYGLWQRWRRRLNPGAACPMCKQIDTLYPACPLCRGQLDIDIGEVDDRVIAVIGASESGKSHYLATVLHQLLYGDVGGDVWKVSMKSVDREIYQREFLTPLFEDHQELESTYAGLGPELRLILENRNDGHRTLLIFRDLGGEIFRDSKLMQELSFLRYAQGVVLMADPLAYEPPAADAVPWPCNGRPPAAEVLSNYRVVLESQERYPEHRALPLLPSEKFLAVVVTKADLVLPGEHAFWEQSDGRPHLESGYWSRRENENREIREWVRDHLGSELVDVAIAFADVGYFFVSSYGFPHQPRETFSVSPQPRRVHEPIFGLLDCFASRGETIEDEDGEL